MLTSSIILLNYALQGHDIVQLHLIFKLITKSLPGFFFAYIQCFIVTSIDQDVGMHILKQALWNMGEHVGNIILLFQICSPAHIIPCFGQVASSNLHSYLSNELSSSFWLNKYWTKEFFHHLSM